MEVVKMNSVHLKLQSSMTLPNRGDKNMPGQEFQVPVLGICKDDWESFSDTAWIQGFIVGKNIVAGQALSHFWMFVPLPPLLH
jgi:hypothetical protein